MGAEKSCTGFLNLTFKEYIHPCGYVTITCTAAACCKLYEIPAVRCRRLYRFFNICRFWGLCGSRRYTDHFVFFHGNLSVLDMQSMSPFKSLCTYSEKPVGNRTSSNIIFYPPCYPHLFPETCNHISCRYGRTRSLYESIYLLLP